MYILDVANMVDVETKSRLLRFKVKPLGSQFDRNEDRFFLCIQVQAIVNTCKRGLSYVTEEMLQCVRERCLDKKVYCIAVVINNNP